MHNLIFFLLSMFPLSIIMLKFFKTVMSLGSISSHYLKISEK